MTTWTPSIGLQRADAVVAEIEQAMEACGVVPPDGKPMRAVLGHRLTEIVANAIDAVIGDGKPFAGATWAHTENFQPLGEPEYCPPIAVYANGHGFSDAQIKDTATVILGAIEKDAAPAKKARGRPKGSTKKAKKSAKGDKAQEAPPAAE